MCGGSVHIIHTTPRKNLLHVYFVSSITQSWPWSLTPMSSWVWRDLAPSWPVYEWGSPAHFAHKVLEEIILEVALRCSRHLAHHTAVIGSLDLGQVIKKKKRSHQVSLTYFLNVLEAVPSTLVKEAHCKKLSSTENFFTKCIIIWKV